MRSFVVGIALWVSCCCEWVVQLHMWSSVVSSSIAEGNWRKECKKAGNVYFTIISVQQNSFDLMFNNLGILLMQHLGRVVPGPEILLVPENRCSVKRIDLKDMFKKASKSVCTSSVALSHDPSYYTPWMSSAMKTKKTQRRTFMTLNQQTKDISRWTTPLISSAAQVWK
jgi:hypothetical protein